MDGLVFLGGILPPQLPSDNADKRTSSVQGINYQGLDISCREFSEDQLLVPGDFLRSWFQAIGRCGP